MLKIEELTSHDLSKRLPFVKARANLRFFFVPDAMFLFTVKIIGRLLVLSRAKGAQIADHTPVLKIERSGADLQIHCTGQTYFAKHVIVTMGGWMPKFFPEWKLPVRVHEAPAFWFGEEKTTPVTAPFLLWTENDIIYGFPDFGSGVKIAGYQPGTFIGDPDLRAPESEQGLKEVQAAIRSYLPGVSVSPSSRHTCYFDLGPDDNLILDCSPVDQQIVLIGAGSGHGFKMAPALATAAVDLTLHGLRRPELEFLRLPSSSRS